MNRARVRTVIVAIVRSNHTHLDASQKNGKMCLLYAVFVCFQYGNDMEITLICISRTRTTFNCISTFCIK